MIEYLTLEDVLALIDDLEVSPIRDAVCSIPPCAARPQATWFSVDATMQS